MKLITFFFCILGVNSRISPGFYEIILFRFYFYFKLHFFLGKPLLLVDLFVSVFNCIPLMNHMTNKIRIYIAYT